MKIDYCELSMEPARAGYRLGVSMSIEYNEMMDLGKGIKNSGIILEGIAAGFEEFVKTQKGQELFDIYKPYIDEQIKKSINAYILQKTTEIMGSIDLKGLANIAALEAERQLGKDLNK